LGHPVLLVSNERILNMRRFAFLFLALSGIGFTVMAPKAKAQVSVNIGVAPDCPYGYYDVPPYTCAPYGYYGPEWFVDGAFVGAGPWFHGPDHFRGHVDNHFRADHGYKGHMPAVGERPEPGRRMDAAHFHGNEMRDGHGHVAKR
jgi:hypothetical protein